MLDGDQQHTRMERVRIWATTRHGSKQKDTLSKQASKCVCGCTCVVCACVLRVPAAGLPHHHCDCFLSLVLSDLSDAAWAWGCLTRIRARHEKKKGKIQKQIDARIVWGYMYASNERWETYSGARISKMGARTINAAILVSLKIPDRWFDK